jgi:excisionase family DNA binding protein
METIEEILETLLVNTVTDFDSSSANKEFNTIYNALKVIHKKELKVNSVEQELILTNLSIENLKNLIRDTIREEVKDNSEKDVEVKPKLLSRNETAEILSISLVTLHEWTKKGLLPAYKIGTRIRLKEDEVFESLNKIKKYEHWESRAMDSNESKL